MQQGNQAELLTVKDVARLTKRHEDTILRHVRQHKLVPLPRKSNREHLRFTMEAYQRYAGLASDAPEAA